MSKDIFFQTRETEVARLVTLVENGETRALKAYAQLKDLESLCKDAAEQIREIAIEEAQTYEKPTFTDNGFDFQLKNGATRYDYKHIPEWQKAKNELTEIEQKHKQAFLAKQKNLLTATEDGEEITLPKVAYNKSSLSVKATKRNTCNT